MIVDSHTHIGKKSDTTKDLLSSMKKAGIDYSMVIADSAPLGNSGLSTDETIEICEQNEKLKAIGNLEYRNLGEKQIKSLVDYLKRGKIHAVKFYPGYEDFYPFDEKLFPLYKQCEELGKAVVFHTGLLAKDLPGRLKQSHPLNIDDVADKFPELKIVMAHFGNPWIVDATMVAMKNENVYVDLSGYFGPTIPKADVKFFKHDLKYLSGFLGGYKKCLFGTDWPTSRQKEYLAAVKQLPLNAEEKDLVLWKNAKEIYGLEIYR